MPVCVERSLCCTIKTAHANFGRNGLWLEIIVPSVSSGKINVQHLKTRLCLHGLVLLCHCEAWLFINQPFLSECRIALKRCNHDIQTSYLPLPVAVQRRLQMHIAKIIFLVLLLLSVVARNLSKHILIRSLFPSSP